MFASIAGWDFGGEYFAGYIVEKSLSVDNLFVFVVIMTTFAVPAEHQQKVLIVGIVARARPARDLHRRSAPRCWPPSRSCSCSSGCCWSAPRSSCSATATRTPTVDDNALVTFARKRLPLTDDYDGGKLLTRIDGRRMFTPLFLVLIAIGSTDILFALDSIPAVFGVTDETFIVLRGQRLRAARPARPVLPCHRPARPARLPLHRPRRSSSPSSAIKLVLHWGHLQDDGVPEIATTTSLAVIAVVLFITTVASVIKARRDPSARAHAGSLRAHPERDPEPATER